MLNHKTVFFLYILQISNVNKHDFTLIHTIKHDCLIRLMLAILEVRNVNFNRSQNIHVKHKLAKTIVWMR